MPSSRQDYILRLIEEIGAALRRVKQRLAGGAPAGEVLHDAQAAQAALFGEMWATLRALDAETAAGLVNDPRQMELWTELLHAEAEAHRRLGDAGRAQALEARAAALRAAAGDGA